MKYLLLFSILLPISLTAQPVPGSLHGPDAPDMTIAWGPDGFTFDLEDPPGSNNEQMLYTHIFIQEPPPPDEYLRFQGYVIYRLLITPDQWPEPFASFGGLSLLKDPSLAVPAIIADKIDAVTTAQDLLVDCTPIQWQFPNAGVTDQYTLSIDPVTNLPFEPDQEYCFVAIAFATNPYFWNDTCNALDQFLMGRMAAFGPIQPQCVTGYELVGMGEQELDRFQILHDPMAEQLNVSSISGGKFLLRCTNALGALMLEETISRASIELSQWPNGLYHATIIDERGNVVEPFVIAR